MTQLDFFKRNKKSKAETVRIRKPSKSQIDFAEAVLEIIGSSVKDYGFTRCLTKVETYYTKIIFRKDKQYIKVDASTYPTDDPYSYNVILGECLGNDLEWDFNAIALWQLIQRIDPNSKSHEYLFPYDDALESVNKANKELLKYGLTFLRGDLTLFYEIRKKLNII